MNFYEKAKDQQLHNKTVFICYTAGYVCFMNTPGSLVDSDDNWYERYLNVDQINREAANALKEKNFELDEFVLDHKFATVYYIAFEVLNRYYGQAIQQQQIVYQDGNLWHACAPLWQKLIANTASPTKVL